MFTLVFRNFSRGNHGDIIHGRMDTDNDIGIVRGNAASNFAFTGVLRMNVRHEFPRSGVTEVIEKAPLLGMRTKVFVRIDEGPVRQTAVFRPYVEQVVRTPRKVELKLFGQRFGRSPVSSTRVG